MKRTVLFCLLNCLLFIGVYGQKDGLLIETDIRKAEKNVSLSSLFTNISYLPLETSRKCLIGEIETIDVINNRIYVLDDFSAKALFVFNRSNGDFEFKIEARGIGPGEFNQINDFAVDHISNQIYILANARNVYKYDSQGTFIEKYDLTFPAFKFVILYDNSFAFRGASHDDELILTDENFKVRKKIFPFRHRRLNYPNTFSRRQEETIYSRLYDCSFYRIEDYDISLYFQLRVKGTKENTKIIEDLLKSGNNDPTSTIRKEGIFIFHPLFSNDLSLFYSNIIHDDKRYLIFSRVKENNTQIYDVSSLKDDIIGGYPFFTYSNTITENNEVVFDLQPYSLIKMKDRIKDAELKNIISKIDGMSNPVLMFGTIVQH